MDQRNEWDPHYAAARVRLEARRFIKSHNLDIAEDDEDGDGSDFDMRRLPNIGLEFYRDGIVAKVLKRAVDPDMPIPLSASLKRIAFCNQQGTLVPRGWEWNTFYLWDCDVTHRFSRLSLVCPRAGGKSKSDMKIHWEADIPLLSGIQKSTVDYGGVDRQTLIEDVPGYSLPEGDIETGTNEP